ncbi:MAG: flagellar biosynthesis protein FlhB [Leptospirales bacterium]
MVFLQLYLHILLNRIFKRSIRVLRFSPGFAGVGDFALPMFFASAENEGRTEEPTERKKQKEREKGRVPKSPDIPSSLVTIGGLATLFAIGGWMLSGMANIATYFLGKFSELPALDKSEVIALFIFLVREVGILLAPIFLVSTFLAIAGNVVQVGIMFTLKPLKPDFKRIKLDFPTMMRKVFFSRQIAVTLIKTLLKVSFLGVISYYLIKSDFDALLSLGSIGVANSVRLLSQIAFKLAVILSVVMFVIALPDYFYQKFEFIESIKMTKEELKQESRESEGDPLVKQRRRQRAFEMLRRNMFQETKKADVVITNPTHYAIALRYDPEMEDSPRVLSKGEDNLAFVIRNLARQNDIPIIENKPLARELYRTVSEGETVPEHFYRVLIDIFLSIDGMKERLSRRAG